MKKNNQLIIYLFITLQIRVARKRINPNPNKNCRSKIIVTIPNNEIGMISMLK